MPIYEFKCSECDSEFETLISAAKVDDARCTSCGAGNPRRLMSVIAGMGGRSADPAPAAPACGAGACARCS